MDSKEEQEDKIKQKWTLRKSRRLSSTMSIMLRLSLLCPCKLMKYMCLAKKERERERELDRFVVTNTTQSRS